MKKNSRIDEQINRINSIKEETFKALDRFGVIVQGPRDEYQNTIIKKWDQNGNLIDEIHYDKNENIVQSSVKENVTGERTEYEYDSDNKIISATTYDKDDISIINKFIYKYNKEELLDEIITYDSEGVFFCKEKYKYDNKKRKLEEIYYKQNGSMITRQSWVYASDGSYEHTQFDLDGDIWEKQYYNKMGIMIKNLRWWSRYYSKQVPGQTRYYNDDGLLIKETDTSVDIVTYEYEKNNKGDWTKRIRYIPMLNRFARK